MSRKKIAMGNFILVKTKEEWDNFKLSLALQHGLEDGSVNWGATSTPTSYPCLVSGVIIDTSIVCVFVYAEDAERLLAVMAVPSPATSESSEFEVEQTSVWSRHMVAFFLAMLHELVSVGITKEERFGPLVTEMLALVDQKHATDLDKLKELIVREFDKGS